GSGTLTFAEYDAYHDALSALVGPYDGAGTPLGDALETVETKGQWVAITSLDDNSSRKNPFDSPGFGGENAVVGSDLREGRVAGYLLSLPYEAGSTGQRVKLTLGGPNSDKYEVLTESGALGIAPDGSFQLTVPSGERGLAFGLHAKQDIDSDATLSLSAQLVDFSGAASHHAHAEVSIAFDAVVESSPGVTSTMAGTAADDNRLAAGGHHEVNGDGAGNRVQGLAGHDEVYGIAGDDVAEGGAGADIVGGGDGNDAVYADGQITEAALRAYIGSSATSATPGAMPAQLLITQTEWLQGGLGDDTVVASDNSDVVFGGGGKDLLVGGAGHDVIDGDDDYGAGDVTNVVIQPGVGPGAPFDTISRPSRSTVLRRTSATPTRSTPARATITSLGKKATIRSLPTTATTPWPAAPTTTTCSAGAATIASRATPIRRWSAMCRSCPAATTTSTAAKATTASTGMAEPTRCSAGQAGIPSAATTTGQTRMATPCCRNRMAATTSAAVMATIR
ncbi:MAG TPA: hypothetical protein VH482_19375, partial [Thermomicrobiales bacterium]